MPTPLITGKPLAFVDIETNGGSVSDGKITEIAIICYDGTTVSTFTSLINPESSVPAYIQQLTGISNDMLKNAPVFAEVAETIRQKLDGHIFVAHNVRFDYSFIKNAFKRLNIVFKAPLLCTVKLSRKLYPQYQRHGLDQLIQRHQLQISARHRAYDDAHAIMQFWQIIERTFTPEHLAKAVKNTMFSPSLPAHIDAEIIESIPNTFGVYLFYGENNLPIYIGKSNRLRQRILSHFSSDYALPKEMSISMQIKRIEHIVCAGEVDALLTESRLIKERMPTMNRQLRRNKSVFSWLLNESQPGLWIPSLVSGQDVELGVNPHLYGLYETANDARTALRKIIKEEKLCSQTLGLEKGKPGTPCFARQLKKCNGACVGVETHSEHSKRLVTAMAKQHIRPWPYKGISLLREGTVTHVIHQWCYLGTAHNQDELHTILQSGKGDFSRDTYRILLKHHHKLIPLDNHELCLN